MFPRSVTPGVLLLVACTAPITFAQEQRLLLPVSAGYRDSLFWLTVPEVQKELAITGEQEEWIIRSFFDMWDECNAASAPRKGLSEEERARFDPQLRQKELQIIKHADFKSRLVLGPKQVKRLDQLLLQYIASTEDVAAATDPPYAKMLGLDDVQKKKLVDLATVWHTFDGSLFSENLSQEQWMVSVEKERVRHKKAHDDAWAVLTDVQKKDWKGLLGEPFEFPTISRPRYATRRTADRR